MLEDILDQYNLYGKSNPIFTMDETRLPLPLKAIYICGNKTPSEVSSGVKHQITVVTCVSAGGKCLPPIVIIMGWKAFSPNLAVGEVPGTIYGFSTKGWRWTASLVEKLVDRLEQVQTRGNLPGPKGRKLDGRQPTQRLPWTTAADPERCYRDTVCWNYGKKGHFVSQCRESP